MVAESTIMIKLHTGSNNDIIHNNYLKNTWVSALVRENCVDCYDETNASCQNNSGI